MAPQAIEAALRGYQQVLTGKVPAKGKVYLRKVLEGTQVTKEGRFTVRFDRTKMLSEASVPDSFSYGDESRGLGMVMVTHLRTTW